MNLKINISKLQIIKKIYIIILDLEWNKRTIIWISTYGVKEKAELPVFL